jgi:CheY-like chemotaxis protein
MRPELAENGADAVVAVRSRRFDAILMDLQMPGMDGLEATRKIRELEALDPALGRTPIIAWTAHSGQVDRERCVAAGMDDFLPKPFSTQQLEAALRRWLGSRERSQATR